jgi:hypothetical protein
VEEFSQLLSVHRVSDVRRIETHRAEPFLLERRPLEVEFAITTLKKYKWLGGKKIPAELIQAGGETCSDIHELIISVSIKEELPEQWKASVIVPL